MKEGVSLFVDKREYTDRREYLIDKVRKRRNKTKELSVAYKGGRCCLCRKLTDVFREIGKCVLVCSNCHREIHAGLLQLPRETVVEKLGEFRESYGRNAMETVSKAC
ncbi:MAG: hypothetical protein ABH844_05120 [Candidatus Omnitrophota bacterium]